MKRHSFTISINAPREKVWEVLWDKASYEKWTSAFAEGSTVQTDDWKQGSKVIFCDATGNGMIARVAENTPVSVMSFEHLGEIKDGVEDTTSDKVKAWAGAMETYYLSEEGSGTLLDVQIDINDEWLAYFQEAWPRAMERIKSLSEQ